MRLWALERCHNELAQKPACPECLQSLFRGFKIAIRESPEREQTLQLSFA